jgi:HNH endonuclease/NUMOD4 motif-containing protein/ribosomal L20-like protein
MNEIWQDILGFEGWYQASNLGRCRVLRRAGGWQWGGKAKEEYPLVMAPLLYRKGYYKVHCSSCGGTRRKQRLFVHRAVWAAFNGTIPKGLTINHIDGNPANNRLDNLELATYAEQIRHATKLGLIRHRTKDGWRKPTMTPEKVRELRRLRSEGWTQTALAKRYNIAQSNVRWILIGKTWRHVV